MSEETPGLPKIPKEVVSKAYDDAVSPAARTVGRSLEGVVRTALRPVDGVVWTLDQAFDWIARRVTASLSRRGVEESDVIRPPAELEARVLRGLQIAGPLPDPTLRQMFAELLATSMQPNSSTLAHPAFAETLAQLVPDEARLMCVLGSRPFSLVHLRAETGCTRKPTESTTYLGYDSGLPRFRLEWRPLESEARMEVPMHLAYYLENLGRLGLAETARPDELAGLKFPPYVELREKVEEAISTVENECPETHTPGRAPLVVEIASATLWGAEFRRACGADQLYCHERGWLTSA